MPTDSFDPQTNALPRHARHGRKTRRGVPLKGYPASSRFSHGKKIVYELSSNINFWPLPTDYAGAIMRALIAQKQLGKERTMQANPRNLIALFEHTLRYVVPIFQRHYVWTEEDQWAPLWDDMLEKFSQHRNNQKTSPHFLGAVILDAVKKKSTRETSRFLVIDGQQRLTTIQLLLAALRDFASECGSVTLANAVSRALFNPDPDLMENRSEEIYKLWPTHFNRKVFCAILNAGSVESVTRTYPLIRLPRKRKPEPRDRLVEAYLFFYARLRELRASCGETQAKEDALLDFYGILKDDFNVVEIILSEQDDSQEIFNSLNARGKPLSQSDLLRSFIFMRAEKSHEDRDSLFDQYWKRFEDPFWDVQTRRGNLWSSRLDLVTRTFLSSKIASVVDAKKVHLEYRNWIRANHPFETVEDELHSFAAYGDRFRYLVEPSGDDQFSEFAQRLQTWDVTTAYPLVIYLFEESGLKEMELSECLHIVESYVVRRLICRKDNKEYNKYLPEVVGRLRREGPSQASLARVLSGGSGSTREWPNDEEFERSWFTLPMYNALQSTQIATILKMIEDKIRTRRTEKVIISEASIEHIMPQEWSTHYPIDGELVPSEMARDWFYSEDKDAVSKWERIREKVRGRNTAIHCIGNLTVVTQPLNAAMRNAPFKDKKDELRNSLLLLNRYFESIDTWDETEMERRARKLLATAKEIWTGPERWNAVRAPNTGASGA